MSDIILKIGASGRKSRQKPLEPPTIAEDLVNLKSFTVSV